MVYRQLVISYGVQEKGWGYRYRLGIMGSIGDSYWNHGIEWSLGRENGGRGSMAEL